MENKRRMVLIHAFKYILIVYQLLLYLNQRLFILEKYTA